MPFFSAFFCKYEKRSVQVSGLPVAMRNFTKKYNTQKMILVTKQDFKEEDGRFYIPLPLFEFFLQPSTRN